MLKFSIPFALVIGWYVACQVHLLFSNLSLVFPH
jgi:hypothetical protein